MRKYNALIHLNSSANSTNLSDMSSLDLTHNDKSQEKLDLMLNMSGWDTPNVGPSNMYYTMDSRRLASRQKKNQHDR